MVRLVASSTSGSRTGRAKKSAASSRTSRSKSIANDEPPDEEVLVDRPEVDERDRPRDRAFRRRGDDPDAGRLGRRWRRRFRRRAGASRTAPSSIGCSRCSGGRRCCTWAAARRSTLRNMRPPAQVAVALGRGASSVERRRAKPVALRLRPGERRRSAQKLVHEALKEAQPQGLRAPLRHRLRHPAATRAMLIEKAAEMGLSPATYVQATPDLMMGDLLKNMRSSQIFSVCGLPEVELRKAKPSARATAALPGRAGRAGHLRSGDDGRPTIVAGDDVPALVPRHRLQRPVLPRVPGVLPAHGGLGRPASARSGASTTTRCGTTSPARRARPSRRASTARWPSRSSTIAATSCWW